MADNDTDVLQKADAFMRRHRVFVAGAAAPAVDAAEPEPPASEEDADIPVLTEVVAAEPVSAAAAIDPDQLRTALAAELDAWLDEQLPAHVMHVLDGITDQMIGQVGEKARSELLPRLLARLDTTPTAPDQGSDEV